VVRCKLLAFFIGSIFAAVGGVLYAPYVGFVSPRSFDLLLSLNVWLMVAFGGRGTILGPVVGPNGSGKTTFVNVVTGYLAGDAGSLALDGRPVAAATPHGMAALGLTRTFQAIRIFAKLTVAENIATAGLLPTRVTRATARRARNAKHISGLHRRGVSTAVHSAWPVFLSAQKAQVRELRVVCTQ
jgi:ABC-type branched-subunit amino acid transport system ATPase component